MSHGNQGKTPHLYMVHSIDSPHLATALDVAVEGVLNDGRRKQLDGESGYGRLKVLVQVNTSGEDSKHRDTMVSLEAVSFGEHMA